MKKREFLLGAAALPILASAKPATAEKNNGPVLLTITGAIGKSNRGPLDPALDQLMKKHGVKFNSAYALDFAALEALPSVTIKPTLEYDGKPHVLSGPLLTDVVQMSGAKLAAEGKVLLRALDGYAVNLSVAEARQHRFIIATHLDGHPLPLGGLGPLWAVYEADSYPLMAAKPLNERFGLCPWGLYHIEV